MADRITYVGLDVHKESIVVALAAGGLRGEAREYGQIAKHGREEIKSGSRHRAAPLVDTLLRIAHVAFHDGKLPAVIVTLGDCRRMLASQQCVRRAAGFVGTDPSAPR